MDERNSIIVKYLSVADSAARLFIKRGISRGVASEDLIQDARLALVKAALQNPRLAEADVFEICRNRVRRVLRRADRDCSRLESMASMAA